VSGLETFASSSNLGFIDPLVGRTDAALLKEGAPSAFPCVASSFLLADSGCTVMPLAAPSAAFRMSGAGLPLLLRTAAACRGRTARGGLLRCTEAGLIPALDGRYRQGTV